MAEGARLDLTRSRRIHVVGAGGAGMSGLATILAAGGHQVSGSDLVDSPALAGLRAAGVDVWVGHDPARLVGVEAVATSTAVPAGDPEVVAARAHHIAVLTRADLLAAVGSQRRVVGVSGTHGKTTTTAMVALVLREAGWSPSFLVGGVLPALGGGAHWGSGEWFVVEADESDGTFLAVGAEAVVVTNVEPDHLDHWGSEAALRAAFERFVAEAPGPRICCVDDPGAAALVHVAPAVTYGTSPSARMRIEGFRGHDRGSTFDVTDGGSPLATVRLSVPGLHNARNATAALALATQLGVPAAEGVRALQRFEGVARRFERRGTAGGVTFVDDYAHLPTEVAATLDAARSGPWPRIVCVFQPHRVSRTAELGPSFGPALAGADVVVVTDVYRAGEAAQPGVTGALVADAVRAHAPGKPVIYIPERADLVDYLVAQLQPGDLCLTLGAGDLTGLPDVLLARMGER